MSRESQSGDIQVGTNDEMREMDQAGRKGLFGRLNTAIQQNRHGASARSGGCGDRPRGDCG